MEQERFKIPKRSLVYLLICGVGVVVFLFVGILPTQRALANLERKIGRVRAEMEGKKIISPLFGELLGKLRAGGRTTLPFPSIKPLPEEETRGLSMAFGEIAQQCDLKTVSVVPDFKSLGEDSKTLRVDVLLLGEFFDFRKFLLLLGEQPHLQRIEQIEIREIPGGREFRVKLSLLIG